MDSAAAQHIEGEWTRRSAVQRWSNALPEWIVNSEAHKRLRAQFKHTLQVIADACDPPTSDGALTGAFGGESLIQAANCARSTFWEHLRRLETLGFVVTLARGGQIRVRTGNRTRNLGNVYGVPGYEGALNDRRSQRERVQIFRDGGVVHRQVLEPGDQATMWLREHVAPPVSKPPETHRSYHRGSPEVGRGVVRKSDGGSPEVGHHHMVGMDGCGVVTQPVKDGGARLLTGEKARRRFPHVELDDLADTHRLLKLFARAVSLGFVANSEADQLLFFTIAEHALRVGRTNPPGLFAATVKDRHQRPLFLTLEDERRAHARLVEHREEGQLQ